MNVWWCAVHNAQGRRERSDACLRFGYPNYAGSCDIRPALVLVRDADGEWPIPADTPKHYWHRDVVNDVLDALEAAKENPQP